jgi:hypothetical protein
MASPLASLYSGLDGLKRKLADAMANPGAAAQQYVGNLNDQAGQGLEMLQQSAPPVGPATQPQLDARNKLAEAMAQAYNPAGIYTGLPPRFLTMEGLPKGGKFTHDGHGAYLESLGLENTPESALKAGLIYLDTGERPWKAISGQMQAPKEEVLKALQRFARKYDEPLELRYDADAPQVVGWRK